MNKVLSICASSFIILQVACLTNTEKNVDKCPEQTRQLDLILPSLTFYGNRQFVPPRNDLELDEHCTTLEENIKMVTSYSRQCLPSFARNIYSMMAKRLKVQLTKRCKSSEGRRNFLNLMACSDIQYMEPAHKCMDSFVAQIEHIHTIAEESQNNQIELVCCTFQLFQECIFEVSKRMSCPHRRVSSEKAIEYVRTVINSMGGDVMDFMCGKYDKVSACKHGHPKPMGQFATISERVFNGTLKARHNSPVRPLLQLFVNFSQS